MNPPSDSLSTLNSILVLLEKLAARVVQIEAVEVPADELIHFPLSCHHVLLGDR